jgi:hypothetical protein
MAYPLVPTQLAERFIDYVGMAGEDAVIYQVPTGYVALISKITVAKWSNPSSGTPQVTVYTLDDGGGSSAMLLPYTDYYDGGMVWEAGLVLDEGFQLCASCTGSDQFLTIQVSGALQQKS